jgi:hypothetical protein
MAGHRAPCQFTPATGPFTDRLPAIYRSLPRLERMVNVVSDAYSRRAAEYVDRFASMGAVHPADRQLVATWADGIEGRSGQAAWTLLISVPGQLVECSLGTL